MPIYEYRCNACGRDFELWRRITDDSLPACTACQSTDVHRQVSMSSFQLKGSGWYVTDYAGKKTNATSHKDSKSDSASSADKPDKTSEKSSAADKKEPATAAGASASA